MGTIYAWIQNIILSNGVALAQNKKTLEGMDPLRERLTANPTIDPQSAILGILSSLLNYIPYMLGALGLIAILYSAFIYVTSFGDPARMESAKKNITWIMIGLLASATIYIVINLIIKIVKPTSFLAP